MRSFGISTDPTQLPTVNEMFQELPREENPLALILTFDTNPIKVLEKISGQNATSTAMVKQGLKQLMLKSVHAEYGVSSLREKTWKEKLNLFYKPTYDLKTTVVNTYSTISKPQFVNAITDIDIHCFR